MSKSSVCAFALALLSLPACSDRVKTYPASGQVFVDGAPAAGAVVVLHPVDAASETALKPSGRVDETGAFVLSTYKPKDGAPAGEYVVAIAWFGDVSKIDPDTGELPVKLGGDYASPATSPLRARIVQGENAIPAFRLAK